MGLVKIEDLSPHPLNFEIYGDTNIENLNDEQQVSFNQLVSSIKENGLLHPIVIDQDFRIISGERRFNACVALGMKEVETKQFEYKDDLRRVNHLIEENRYRIKSNIQLIKEGAIKEKLAEGHKKDILKKTGETSLRDAIGKDLGMSGKTFEEGKKVLKVIEQLKEDGKTDEAIILEKKADKSIHGALRSEPNVDKNSPYAFRPALAKLMVHNIKAINGLRKNLKSDTSESFMQLLKVMEMNIEKYSEWLEDEKMSTCHLCDGAGVNKLGEQCKFCIDGKIGYRGN